MDNFEQVEIEGRIIIVKGLGRMFYEQGIPIGMMAREFEKRGAEVSWFHIADELQKHGWPEERILLKLKEEAIDSDVGFNEEEIYIFLHSRREHQRKMIFDYLFNGNMEAAQKFLMSKLQTNEGNLKRNQ